MTYAYLPYTEIEAHALAVLAAYERIDGPVLKPPIPVDHIVEDVCNLVIDWTDGEPFDRLSPDDRVLAAISITRTHRKLLMNEFQRPFFDRYLGTMEYSKAHEVGHATLHLTGSLDLQGRLLFADDGLLLCRSDNNDRQEIQAERFAAYLLMPEYLVHAAIGTRSITSRADIDDLRTLFRVSWTAMKLRLEQLDLAYIDPAGHVYPSRAHATGQRRLF